MLFWIYFSAVCLSFYLIEFIEPPRLRPLSRIIFVVFLIIITGFRDNVGTDFPLYSSAFYSVEWGSYYIEPSFTIIAKLLRFLGFNEQMLFLVYAALIYIFLFKAIKRYELNSIPIILPMIAYIFILFLLAPLNQMRQGLAAIILLWGAPYIATRECKKYMLTVFCATMIHYSAIIIGICYFFAHRYYSKTVYLLTVLVALIFSFLEILPKIIEYSFPYIAIIEERYLWYENNDYVQNITALLAKGFLWLFITLFRTTGKNKYENVIYNMYTFSIISKILLDYSPLFNRIPVHYFEIFFILAMPLSLSTIKWTSLRIMLRGAIFICLLFAFFYFGVGIEDTRLDYKFNFNIFQ
jgi:hypothetical protein